MANTPQGFKGLGWGPTSRTLGEGLMGKHPHKGRPGISRDIFSLPGRWGQQTVFLRVEKKEPQRAEDARLESKQVINKGNNSSN